MAGLTTRSNGTRFIQFMAGDGERKTVRLGRMPKKEAATILSKVEALAAAGLARTSWDRETAEWVGRLDAALHDRLAKAGLVHKQAATERATMAAFIADHLAKRTDLKPGTMFNLQLSK